MRVGVFGGTFNPIHLGHLVIAETAAGEFSLEKVLFVPCSTPPHKTTVGLAPVQDRVEMVRRAIEGNPRFGLSRLEADRPGPSYTVDTLEALGRERPGDELWLIVGADMAATMGAWNRPERIRELARLGVANREGFEEGPVEGGHFRIPTIGVSSREIRAAVAAGRSIRYLVPDSVRQYIGERGLYRS